MKKTSLKGTLGSVVASSIVVAIFVLFSNIITSFMFWEIMPLEVILDNMSIRLYYMVWTFMFLWSVKIESRDD